MTKREFISRRDSFKNRTAIASLVMFAVLMASAFALAHFNGEGSDSPPFIRLLVASILIACLLGAIPALTCFNHRLAKNMGLACPHCQKLISGMSAIVITTGKCGHCGETVLDTSN